MWHCLSSLKNTINLMINMQSFVQIPHLQMVAHDTVAIVAM